MARFLVALEGQVVARGRLLIFLAGVLIFHSRADAGSGCPAALTGQAVCINYSCELEAAL